MTHTMVLYIPYPPSANALWRFNRGGRVTTSVKYKKWHHDASRALTPQIRGSGVFGAYELNISLSKAVKRGDADNRIKAVHDLLQSVGVIVNDKLCTRTTVERADTGIHDCVLMIAGEFAYKNQWEFAEDKARKKPGRR